MEEINYAGIIEEWRKSVLDKINISKKKAEENKSDIKKVIKYEAFIRGMLRSVDVFDDIFKNQPKASEECDLYLNTWDSKIIDEAEFNEDKADNYELGSKEYFQLSGYATGLRTSLSLFSLQEKKYIRKLEKS